MFKAIMEGGTFEEADCAVRELRDIEVHKVRCQDRNLSAWMEESRRRDWAPRHLSASRLCGHRALYATPGDGRRQHPLCQHKQRAAARQLRDPARTTDKLEAIAWGRTPCHGCFSLAGAKWQP